MDTRRLCLAVALLALAACARTPPPALTDAEMDRIRAGTLTPASCGAMGLFAPHCAASFFDVSEPVAPISSTCGGPTCLSAAPVTSSGPVSIGQEYRSPYTTVQQSTVTGPAPVDPRVLDAQRHWQLRQDWLLRPRP